MPEDKETGPGRDSEALHKSVHHRGGALRLNFGKCRREGPSGTRHSKSKGQAAGTEIQREWKGGVRGGWVGGMRLGLCGDESGRSWKRELIIFYSVGSGDSLKVSPYNGGGVLVWLLLYGINAVEGDSLTAHQGPADS